MLPTATHTRPNRRTLYAGLGAAVLGAAALVATISAVDSAADAVLGAASAVTQDSGPDAAVPLLAAVHLPPAPGTCSPANLDERAAEVTALQQAQAAEQRALSDGSTQLADVRSQGQAAVARIQAIDAGCDAG